MTETIDDIIQLFAINQSGASVKAVCIEDLRNMVIRRCKELTCPKKWGYTRVGDRCKSEDCLVCRTINELMRMFKITSKELEG